jgi:DNA-directed RNA polymerase III subunit RPC4
MARKTAEMTAGGPFSLGPALMSSASRQSTVRTSLALAGTSPAPGITATPIAAPPLKGEEPERCIYSDGDEEPFSEPDEGVEIVDLHAVRKLDWMAPESLRRGLKEDQKAKHENGSETDCNRMVGQQDGPITVVDSFLKKDSSVERREQLFSFQFPAPSPEFSLGPFWTAQSSADLEAASTRKVTFAAGISTQPVMSSSGAIKHSDSEVKDSDSVDGVIGQLELYRNGIAKLRLANGVLLEVSSATPLAFPQQAIILDREINQMIVLGDISKRCVVSPDVDALLTAMDNTDKASAPFNDGEEGLLRMEI